VEWLIIQEPWCVMTWLKYNFSWLGWMNDLKKYYLIIRVTIVKLILLHYTECSIWPEEIMVLHDVCLLICAIWFVLILFSVKALWHEHKWKRKQLCRKKIQGINKTRIATRIATTILCCKWKAFTSWSLSIRNRWKTWRETLTTCLKTQKQNKAMRITKIDYKELNHMLNMLRTLWECCIHIVKRIQKSNYTICWR
jgi:hypothetical protein